MILDIARHKFYEGLITLFVTTIILVTLLATQTGNSGVEPAVDSPLMQLIESATFGSGFLKGLAVVLIYATSVLSLSRATLRAHIYPVSTMAPMALCAVMMMPMITTGDALHQAVIIMLMTYSLSNMFHCFSHRKCVHRLFTAMFAASTLAVVEASMVVVPVAMCLALIAARKKFREAIVVVVGMLLPFFAYCYTEWLLGTDFSSTTLLWWRSFTTPLSSNILDNITLTRLVFIAYIVILHATASIFQLTQRDTDSSVVRGSWRALQLLFIVELCSVLLLPSASDSMLTALAVTASSTLSIYFIRSGALLGVVGYVALSSLAIAAAI